MQTNTPRIAFSDKEVALNKGRTVAQVTVELPAGFDALPLTLKSREFRAAFAIAADHFDDYLMRTA